MTKAERELASIRKAREMGQDKFVPALIHSLRGMNPKTKEPYPGVHSKYTRFSATLEKVYEKPITVISKELVDKGIVTFHPTKGGFMYYVKGEEPSGGSGDQQVLNAIEGAVK